MTDEYNKKPKGFFKYVLAIDSETTGIGKGDDPSVGQQAISWGIIVADAQTLLPVEKLYVEIKYNDESRKTREVDPTFGVGASDIHGLTFAHLEEHGVTEEEAVVQILELILKYWGPTQQLKCLGHNVVSFDIPFMKSMFRRFGVEVMFASRHCDSNSVGFAVLETYTSDQFFSTMGFTDRSSHNALEDIYQSLESCRRIRVLWDAFVKDKMV